MEKIGSGLGTFSMMGKMVSFAPLYNSMASIASSIAKAKADAEKQRQKAESDANKKIQDFLLTEKGKNMYTEKYAPIAREAQDKMIRDIYEDKKRDPNGWMNTATYRMLEAQKTYTWAAEQSKMQTDIEKMAADGYMVPQSLLKEFRTNYGDLEGIKEMAPELEDYGITVDPKTGVLARANLQKPVEIGDEFAKFKSSRASYGPSGARTEEIIHRDIDGKPIKDESGKAVISDRVVTYKELTPESLENFKIESSQNPAIRQTFKVRRRAEVEREMAELKAMQQASGLYNVSASSMANLDDRQLKELAVTRAINRQISSFDKTMETGSSVTKRSSGKGITVNVGKPEYVQPQDVFFEETDKVVSIPNTPTNTFRPNNPDYANYKKEITQGGGSFERTESDGTTYVYTMGSDGNINKYKANTGAIYGFNAETVYKKQGQAPADVTVAMIRDSKIYHPRSKAPLGSSDKATILKAFNNASITDYYYIDGKVFASATVQFKPSENYSIPGINSFLIEVPRNSKLDTIGKNLASSDTKKYASMYDYFKDMAPSGGAAQPSGTGASQTSSRSSYPVGGLNK